MPLFASSSRNWYAALAAHNANNQYVCSSPDVVSKSSRLISNRYWSSSPNPSPQCYLLLQVPRKYSNCLKWETIQ
jgi:hypothetical protein